MNSLGIVARAVLMEAEGRQEESRARKYGRRAAIGAGVAGGAYLGGMGTLGAYRGYQSAGSMGQTGMERVKTMGRGASAAIRRPGAALRPLGQQIKGAASRGAARVKAAMQSAYARAMNVGSTPAYVVSMPDNPLAAHIPVMPRSPGYIERAGAHIRAHKKKYAALGAALGAAGLARAGYDAYKIYQKRAKQAAREAYYNTYMSLMEAAEQEQESGFRKWGRRAAIGAGLAGAAHVGTGAVLGAIKGSRGGKGLPGKGIVRGAIYGMKRSLMAPGAQYANIKKNYQMWGKKIQPNVINPS